MTGTGHGTERNDMADFTRDNDKKYLAKGWDESEEVANKSGSWIKLEDGEAIEVVIVGEPEVFEKTFNGEPSKRWSIDVWLPKDEVMKTWEMSKTTFGDVKRQRQIRGDKFGNCVFRLERQGTGMGTKYALDYLRTLEGNELDMKNAQLIKGGGGALDEGGKRIPF
jgi:hypothetical protein